MCLEKGACVSEIGSSGGGGEGGYRGSGAGGQRESSLSVLGSSSTMAASCSVSMHDARSNPFYRTHALTIDAGYTAASVSIHPLRSLRMTEGLNTAAERCGGVVCCLAVEHRAYAWGDRDFSRHP